MKSPLLFLLAAVSLVPAQAALLVDYPFTSGANPTVSGANLTATPAAWNGFTAQYGFSNSTGTAYVRSDQTSSTFNSSQYLDVTITADTGFQLNLTSFSFALGGSNSGGNAATVNSNLRSNAEVTPFTTNITLAPGSVTTASQLLPANTTLTFTTFTADLSAPQYQGLDSISFRLFVFDTSSSATVFLRFDSLSLEGSVAAVPEPSTALLLSSVVIAGLWIARRRK